MTVELEDSISIPGLEGRPIAKLLPAFKTRETKSQCLTKLRMFLKHYEMSADELIALAWNDPLKAEEMITAYVLEMKKTVSGSTVHNFAIVCWRCGCKALF